MHTILITVGLALFLLSSCIESNTKDFSSEHTSSLNDSSTSQTNSFDSSYAAKLGADDYGMKQYVIAFLYTGNNRPTKKNIADSLQSAHLSNISKMAEDGKLVLAGPFMMMTVCEGYTFLTHLPLQKRKPGQLLTQQLFMAV